MSYDKHFWNKQNEFFVTGYSWDKPEVIKVEHTGFFANHSGCQGPNTGETGLLDFSTRIYEASAVHFVKCAFQGDGVRVLIQERIGTCSSDRLYLRLKIEKKYHDVFTFEGEDELPYVLKNVSNEKQRELKYILSHSYKEKELNVLLQSEGIEVLEYFRFSIAIHQKLPHHGGDVLQPVFIKERKNSLELGWISNGTYNSLPNTVKVTKTKEIKTVKLQDIGAETVGYYDHHYRCVIPVEQRAAAESFAKKFIKKKTA